MKKLFVAAIAAVLLISGVISPQAAQAYPFWAQQNYETPREATGRIVCANCHLAQKPIEVEIPQSVLPNTVFEAVVKIPYPEGSQQVQSDGSKAGLNVGAVVMLPEGFKIAPEDRIPAELKEKIEGLYYQPYAEDKENIVLIGPLPGDEYQELVFPVLSPDPATDKNVHFLKYAVHVGGNRGRGQIYPTGEKSNNNLFTAPVEGTISAITPVSEDEGGGYQVTIETAEGKEVVETIPAGPELVVSQGAQVAKDAPLTVNPNVGGFGQVDAEIVLQSPDRVKWLIAFFASVAVSQLMLVLKKKQVEKVQAAEMNF
ncbi:cytochrome f [Leptolyngbya sp. FACHB-261]|uniref:cytochrome f n=1 Tax=Leptolyngbya sp. FACHB-261 TaxID=2692806 RepID=UPI0016868D24|nr:apocytochrome f [Leptolyngbya sp. FACHB-261]MBD2101555.1 apocytochrome f [Leptolyngbya sp. FACHB-261]